MTHQCIKPGCSNSYQDEDVEAYYCPSCNQTRKMAASEIDTKFNTRGQVPNDMFAGSKEMTTANGGKANFFKA